MGGFSMGMGRRGRRIEGGSILCVFGIPYIKKGCVYYPP